MKDRFDMFRITSGMDMALGRSGGSVDPSNVNKGSYDEHIQWTGSRERRNDGEDAQQCKGKMDTGSCSMSRGVRLTPRGNGSNSHSSLGRWKYLRTESSPFSTNVLPVACLISILGRQEKCKHTRLPFLRTVNWRPEILTLRMLEDVLSFVFCQAQQHFHVRSNYFFVD